MKEISELKKKLEILYAQKHCGISNLSLCKKNYCTCSVAAEIKAYIDSVIPYPYNNYNIKDFTGEIVGGGVKISDYIYLRAKKELIDYCWNDVYIENINKLSIEEINKKSIIQHRYKQNKNVAIFSDDIHVSDQPSGKTMIAALILKEAIKSRINSRLYSQTYDWIQYSTLKDKLVNDPDSLANTKLCDWLVVDDITNDTLASKNQKIFISSKLDPFFNERSECNLPTIFVFRFDINSVKALFEETFGVAMSKIVMNKLTHNIDLTNG